MSRFLDRRIEQALKSAEAPAIQRILDDAATEGLPAPVRTLLVHLSKHLFDPKLTVGGWRRAARVGDNNVPPKFKEWFGEKMKDYYRWRRVETAIRMLAATDLDPRHVGRAVGFSSYRAFRDLYKRWLGKEPGEGRDRPALRLEPKKVMRVAYGALTDDEAVELVEGLYRLYPHVRPKSPPSAPESVPKVRTIVDGREYERFHAEQLWQRIETLPFDEQKPQVRGYLYRSTALFDLLRKKSREEGRKNRERGVELARLALLSLEEHDEVFGDQIYDLRALGWAHLANAQHLMLDFDGAEENLANADDEWAMPRAMTDLTVSAEIQLIKAALRTCQRRYTEALERVEDSIRLSEITGNAVLEAQALTVQASVKGYMERLEESASDLRRAAAVIEGRNQTYLDFTISLNQANVYARLGQRERASAALALAATRCERIDDRLGWPRIHHLKGTLRELVGAATSAETSYLKALEGFVRVDEPRLAVFVSLDLAIMKARHGDHHHALELVLWSIPILQSMKLHAETMAAIELLAQESAARRVDQGVLSEVARLLTLDPLVRLDRQTRAGRVPRPPVNDT